MPHKGKDTALEDQIRFRHMLDATEDAVSFARGRKREDLDNDAMLLRAMVQCVQVIEEAASRMTRAGRDRAPSLPWSKIVGMRHILVHVYYDIDADAVWKVVQEHLPLLRVELEGVLRNWSGADPERP